MKTLEDKIIAKVYAHETVDICMRSFLKLAVIIVTGVTGVVLGLLVIRTIVEQKTFDMFEILFEDFEIIKVYLLDVVITIYEELPKFELLAIFMSISAFLLLVGTVFFHLNKYINKIKSLLKFWFPQRI